MPKRTDTVKLQCQLPREVMEEIRRLVPEILDPAKPTTFRWGGLQQYIMAVLIKDLSDRRKMLNAKNKLQASE